MPVYKDEKRGTWWVSVRYTNWAAPSSISTGNLPFGKSSQSQPSKPEVAWAIGDIAHHKKWGDGTVLAVSGIGNSQELKINFPEVGLKKVLASIAPIEKKS